MCYGNYRYFDAVPKFTVSCKIYIDVFVDVIKQRNFAYMCDCMFDVKNTSNCKCVCEICSRVVCYHVFGICECMYTYTCMYWYV